MKQYIEFELNKRNYPDGSFERVVFRFYPKRTHVHGFEKDSPTAWNEVYKVYYAWAILKQWEDTEAKNPKQRIRSHVLFEMPCDECSQIPNLAEIIRYVIETGKTWDYPTFVQPAGEWCIEDKSLGRCKLYRISVFDNWSNQGYRFYLIGDEVNKFCDYLDEINAYALAHSEGI